jgi:S-adenosylmethionine decarboxylase
LHKGKHLLIDCANVSAALCLDDRRVLRAMADAAERAGATVISQVRYRFEAGSPPGFTAVVLLDESHCSAHTYADLGLMALDIFTCGDTEPREVLRHLQSMIDLGDVTVREVERFGVPSSPIDRFALPRAKTRAVREFAAPDPAIR